MAGTPTTIVVHSEDEKLLPTKHLKVVMDQLFQ